jgi:hypothetical protein
MIAALPANETERLAALAGYEILDSILVSSLAGDAARCLGKRRPEVPVGRAIELRKADGSGCRLPSEMEEGNTATTLFASGCPVLRSLRTRAR